VRVIFITGAQGTGKSFVATEVANRLGIKKVMSTDIIRELIRKSIQRTPETEVLHRSAVLTDLVPEAKHPEIRGFKQQAKYLQEYIRTEIEQSKKKNKDIIFEGIHLLPGLIDIDPDVNFTHIILYVKDEERHKNQIIGQGENRAPYKLKNFSRIRSYQSYLLEKADKLKDKYNFKVIESDDQTINNVINSISKPDKEQIEI